MMKWREGTTSSILGRKICIPVSLCDQKIITVKKLIKNSPWFNTTKYLSHNTEHNERVRAHAWQ